MFQNYTTEVAAVHRSCNVKVNKWEFVDPLWNILIYVTNNVRAGWINLTQDKIQCRAPVNIVMRSKFVRVVAICLTRTVNTTC